MNALECGHPLIDTCLVVSGMAQGKQDFLLVFVEQTAKVTKRPIRYNGYICHCYQSQVNTCA